jgi:hypothetical protein
VPDLLADLQEVIRTSGKPGLKRERLIKQVDKLGYKWERAGVDLKGISQRQFCEVLAESAGVFVQKGEMGEEEKDPRKWMMKLCVARLRRGDFSDWTGWEYRNEWAQGSYSSEVPNKRWRLEPIKSLAVLGEQGIGDEVMFGSCLPEVMVRVPRVVFECDPRLVEVFKRSLPGLETKPRADIEARGDPVVKYLTKKRDEEAFIPVGDLPRLFRKGRRDFPGRPFLKALPEKVEKWRHLKGRTGIAWRSRTGQIEPGGFRRDCGLDEPVCLQYDAWEYETEGMTVPECDLRNDVEDLLGIVTNLGKVVTVPQTVVHFAGAIGTPVEVVMPPSGSSRIRDDFRWRYIDPMPWYPSTRVYPNLNAFQRR